MSFLPIPRLIDMQSIEGQKVGHLVYITASNLILIVAY